MNYRHAYHAGNFADVVKHVALVAVLLHLQKKEAPFAVIDSHAGRGCYNLAGDEAQKTGEAAAGIEKLRGLPADGALGRYLEIVGGNQSPPHVRSALAGEIPVAGPRASEGRGGQSPPHARSALVGEIPVAGPRASEGRGGHDIYPGSPLIAAKMLRPQDRLVAVEKHLEEFAALKQALHPWRKARVEEGDGYDRLMALLPPPERRGLVLIDPPFEAQDEFAAMADALRGALKRFANGIYLVWFPIKAESEARRFLGEVLAQGAAKALRMDISINASEGKLASAGLLIINPPFGFAQEMQEILDRITPLMAGRGSLEWLVGQDN